MKCNLSGIILLLFVLIFFIKPSFSNNDSKNINLENSLINIGSEIAGIIISKDSLALLKYVDKEKWHVNYGGNLSKSYDEVKNDLNNPSSSIYCFLFDSSCMLKKGEKSIRDYLVEAKSNNLTVEVKVWQEFYEIWGKIVYTWDEKPKDLWVSKFPNPKFVYTKNGWKFIKLFSE